MYQALVPPPVPPQVQPPARMKTLPVRLSRPRYPRLCCSRLQTRTSAMKKKAKMTERATEEGAALSMILRDVGDFNRIALFQSHNNKVNPRVQSRLQAQAARCLRAVDSAAVVAAPSKCDACAGGQRSSSSSRRVRGSSARDARSRDTTCSAAQLEGR